MEFKVEILSRETIKPSSPTPQSLRMYHLSFLDQQAPRSFIPHIYFYSNSPNTKQNYNSEKSDALKSSLSRILTKFYPLAGRLVDNRYVDCNDEGAPYVEAEVDCDLNRIIKDPKPRDMIKFLPFQVDDIQNLNMAVQVTFFRCGSIAIGLMVSHVIADGQSFFNFANSWAMVTRRLGLGDTTAAGAHPRFESASIFPPHASLSVIKPNITGSSPKEEVVTKIFTFPSSKISTLRDIYASDSPNTRPTRVVALSSFICTRFVSATQLIKPSNANITLVVLLAANLRSRFKPPLSEDYFGNMNTPAVVIQAMGDGGYYELSRKVTEAVNKELVAPVMERDKYLNDVENTVTQAIKGEVVIFTLSSLCRFPVYEGADFGWGKPAWVGSAPLPFKNVVSFIDTALGDGIEAWISLEKEDMNKFEADLELQAFLSPAFDDEAKP